MSVRKLNVRTCDLDESLWPYHYHHAVEEWIYVISGGRCCGTGATSGRWPAET
jgi:hypothetical protein